MTIQGQELEIVALGAQGDGIAETDAGPRYVPFALPGELWRVSDGDADVLLRPHPARANPVCRHFRSCGGCVAQHMPDEIYAAWKRTIVVQAFRHRGIDAPIDPLYRVPRASRRRVTLCARRYRKNLHLGFYRAATHSILNVVECPVAVPQIVSALPVLREMLGPLLSGPAEAAIEVIATPAGPDVHMTFLYLDVGSLRNEYPRLATLAARHGFARLTVERDLVVQARRPMLTLRGVDVEPPPNAFVQAVEAAEQEMIRLVLAAVGKPRRVADLFCGLGTFALPLAHHTRVLAVDGDESAIAALGAAARRAQGLKPIEAKVRDLFREPLSVKELEGFGAVVFDPPRTGAKNQARELARSKVHTVVAVSCDPGTLARDTRILVDGGYTIDSVTPIDQFLFSAHVEVVAVLRRNASLSPSLRGEG